MRRITRLATWCLGEHSVRHDKPDWLGGAIFAAFLLLILAVVSLNDAYTESQEAVADRDKTITSLRAEIAAHDSSPSVIIEGENFECRQFHIRAEWSLAVGQKCQELAALIRVARAAP